MFKSFYLFIYAGCLDCVAASSIRLPFFGFPRTQFSVFGLGLGLRVFTWRTNPLTAARPQLSLSFSLSLSSIRNETDNCMFWLSPAIVLPLPLGSACVAVAVTVAVAAAAAGVLRWLCTCDNIFIIFASFLLPLLRCHRHRRIANGRCVCKH